MLPSLSLSGCHRHFRDELNDAIEAFTKCEEYMAANPIDHKSTPANVAAFSQCMFTAERKRAAVIIFGAAYIETLANLYISLKAPPASIPLLERATLVEKWTVVPAFFVPAYTLSRGEVLGQDLSRVAQYRNRLLHLKERVVQNGDVMHEGTLPARRGDEQAFVARCGTLPNALLNHVLGFDTDEKLEVLRFIAR